MKNGYEVIVDKTKKRKQSPRLQWLSKEEFDSKNYVFYPSFDTLEFVDGDFTFEMWEANCRDKIIQLYPHILFIGNIEKDMLFDNKDNNNFSIEEQKDLKTALAKFIYYATQGIRHLFDTSQADIETNDGRISQKLKAFEYINGLDELPLEIKRIIDFLNLEQKYQQQSKGAMYIPTGPEGNWLTSAQIKLTDPISESLSGTKENVYGSLTEIVEKLSEGNIDNIVASKVKHDGTSSQVIGDNVAISLDYLYNQQKALIGSTDDYLVPFIDDGLEGYDLINIVPTLNTSIEDYRNIVLTFGKKVSQTEDVVTFIITTNDILNLGFGKTLEVPLVAKVKFNSNTNLEIVEISEEYVLLGITGQVNYVNLTDLKFNTDEIDNNSNILDQKGSLTDALNFIEKNKLDVEGDEAKNLILNMGEWNHSSLNTSSKEVIGSINELHNKTLIQNVTTNETSQELNFTPTTGNATGKTLIQVATNDTTNWISLKATDIFLLNEDGTPYTPTNDDNATTKKYVDDVSYLSGLRLVKESTQLLLDNANETGDRVLSNSMDNFDLIIISINLSGGKTFPTWTADRSFLYNGRELAADDSGERFECTIKDSTTITIDLGVNHNLQVQGIRFFLK